MSDGTRYDRPVTAAPPPVCPDCGGKGWRRQIGSAACACLVEEVRTLRARVADAETKLAASHEAIGILRHELREVREGLAILRSHARFGGVP